MDNLASTGDGVVHGLPTTIHGAQAQSEHPLLTATSVRAIAAEEDANPSSVGRTTEFQAFEHILFHATHVIPRIARQCDQYQVSSDIHVQSQPHTFSASQCPERVI